MNGLFLYRKNADIVKRNVQFLRDSEKDLFLTGLIFDKDDEYSTEDFDEELNLELESLSIKNILKTKDIIKQKKIDCAYIPCTDTELSKKNQDIAIEQNDLIRIGLFLSFCGIKKIYYIFEQKLFSFTQLQLMKNDAFILLKRTHLNYIIAPFIILLLLPSFVKNDLIPNFFLNTGDKNDEITGYGIGKKISGHMFFLTRAKWSKIYGIFGINHRDYMGTPITLHRSPFDILFFRYLGYRDYVLFSFSLVVISLLSIIFETKHYVLIFLIPFIFLSTYFTKSLVVGHLELLAWGFLSISIVSYIFGFVGLSAIFLAFTLLTHISIALIGVLSILSIEVYNIFFGNVWIFNIFFQWFCIGIIISILTFWYLIPFIRSRNKFSRNDLLKTEYGWTRSFNFYIRYIFLSYMFLVILSFIVIPFNTLHLMLFLPLLLLYYNNKIRSIFSQYTLELSIIIIYSIFLMFNPNLYCGLFFVYIIFTSPEILLKDYYGIDWLRIKIIPIRLGPIRTQIEKLFSKLPENTRIAFEAGNRAKNSRYYLYNALFSYILFDTKIDLLNAYAPEFVESSIYFDIVRYIDKDTPQDMLNNVLNRGGAEYLLTYSDPLKENLIRDNNTVIGTIDLQSLQFNENDIGPKVCLFKLKNPSSIIEPEECLYYSPNQIRFYGKANTKYLLKYNYYFGWRAHQNNIRLIVKDAHPGMIIESSENGLIELTYRYRNYLFFS